MNPNPEAIRQKQIITSWTQACLKLVVANHEGHITDEQQKELWRIEFEKHTREMYQPALKLNDLLKPRPLNFEETK